MSDFNAANVKAITFDLGDEKGLTLDWTAFAVYWRSLYDPAMKKVRDADREYVILDQLHRENLDQVLEKFEVAGHDEATHEVWHRLPPWPDVVAGLTRLKSAYIIGTLSNGNIALMVNLARHSGLPWDVILGAEITRAYKPSPESYTRTASALGLAPSQCMLVAAHNGDLAAAREQGFRTGFVPRLTEHGPDQSIDLEAESDWDVVATDFVDLAAKLNT